MLRDGVMVAITALLVWLVYNNLAEQWGLRQARYLDALLLWSLTWMTVFVPVRLAVKGGMHDFSDEVKLENERVAQIMREKMRKEGEKRGGPPNRPVTP